MALKKASVIQNGDVPFTRKMTEKGTVLVYPGQEVIPSSMIAQRSVWSGHFSVNLRQALNLTPTDKLHDYLEISEGDFVSVNELIAKKNNRGTNALIAKRSGRFLGISSGNLIFEAQQEVLEECVSGFPGIVSKVIADYGAELEARGSFFDGIWGNGKSGQGILMSADDGKSNCLTLESLTPDISGTIIVADTCLDVFTLKTAAKLSPGGLIFGSLPSALLSAAEKLPVPVMITDMIGIGRISAPVQLLISENIIKYAFLFAPNGTQINDRPEVLIPLDEIEQDSEKNDTLLKPGTRVKILEGYYIGEIGTVKQVISRDLSDQPFEDMNEYVLIQVSSDVEVELPIVNVLALK